jgi:succinoglycan biosynthesis transport protein ExoP
MNEHTRGNEAASSTTVGTIQDRGSSLGTLSPIRETDLAPAFPSPPPAIYGPPSDALEGGVDVIRLWHSLRRCWLPAVCLGLVLAAVLAPLPWFLLPKGYEAVAWLRVRSTAGSFSTAGAGNYEQYRKTQLQLITSPFVLTSALRQPGLASLSLVAEQDDPVDWLARNVRTSAPAESEVMLIRLRGPHASDVTKVVNAVAQAYLNDVVNKEKLDRLARRDMLERKYKDNMAEVRRQLETFNSLARSLGTRDSAEVSTQRSLLLDHLGTLRSSLVQSQGDLARIDAELALNDARSRGEIPMAEGAMGDDVIDSLVMRHPEVTELTNRLARIEDTIASHLEISARGSNDPVVRRLSAQRVELSERLNARIAALRPQLAAQAPADAGRKAGTETAPAVLRFRREMLAKRLEEVSKEFDEVAREVTNLGNANADLEARRSEIQQLQKVTNELGVQLNATEIDLATPNRVELLEEARVPSSNDTVTRILFTALAALLGFVTGGTLVLLLEYLRDRMSVPSQITQRAGLRVIGTVPRVSRSAKRPNGGEIAECVDGLRAVLVQTGPEQPKVILVTSAREHEGKTTFATQLAASFARAGSRTLLVDGDLRHPNVHFALGLDLRTGLPELLRGEITPDEAVQPTSVDGLFAVTGGVCDYASVAALARPQTPALVKHYRASFDHVVIDAGPVLAFADVLFLGQAADAAILVTMRDVTRMGLVDKALERLRSVGIRVLGAVVNGVNDATPRQLYASRSMMS